MSTVLALIIWLEVGMYPRPTHMIAIDIMFVATNFVVSRCWNIQLMDTLTDILDKSEVVSQSALCFNLAWIIVSSEAMSLLSSYWQREVGAKNSGVALHKLSNLLLHDVDCDVAYAVIRSLNATKKSGKEK